MSEFEQIRYDVADHVATIELYRSDAMNAFTEQMMNEIIAPFDRIDADDDARGDRHRPRRASVLRGCRPVAAWRDVRSGREH